MSALPRPVGGLAWTTLSILNISSRPSELTGSPVNGEVSACLPPGPGEDPDEPGLPRVSAKMPPARIAAAATELPAVINARRLSRTRHLPGRSEEHTSELQS